jgi:HEAT repeat protein
MGFFGPPNINRLKARRNIEGLIKALEYPKDNQVRIKAARALGELGDMRAVEPITQALKYYVSSDLQVAAAGALGQIGARQSDSALRGRVIAPLCAALKDIGHEGRQAAAAALEMTGWHPGQDELGAFYWATKREWSKCIQIGAPAVKPLIAEIKDYYSGGTLSKEAAIALGQIADPSALEALTAATHDESVLVRRGAVAALGQIADPRVCTALVKLLVDTDKETSTLAASALVKIGAPAVESLITDLKNYEGAAAGVLEQINRQSDDGALRMQIVAALIEALKGRWTRQMAANALGKIGDPKAVEPLIAVLRELRNLVPERQAAAEALGKIGDAGAYEPLITALNDRSSEVSQAAIGALEKIGNPGAVAPLIAVLQDAKWSVRKAAAEALVRLYQSDRLDKSSQELILSQRGRMAAEHYDRSDHQSSGGSSDCHTDINKHTDNNGIGVTFPV